MAALLFAAALSGCTALGYLPPQRLPYTKLVFPYENTQLKISTTLDVLNAAKSPAYQFEKCDKAEELLLTQSDTAVAFSGRSADRRRWWVTLVVFDEYRLTAKRKYFFLVDEKAETAPMHTRDYLIPPRKGLAFDGQFVVDTEILTTPYATEDAQKVAMIRRLAEQFQTDVAALIGGSKAPARGSTLIPTAAMMMRQTFTGLLTELDKSPGLAQLLADPRGMEFPHVSMDKGHVRLLTQDDLATMTLRVNFPLEPLPTGEAGPSAAPAQQPPQPLANPSQTRIK
jgi:hypothetical protein